MLDQSLSHDKPRSFFWGLNPSISLPVFRCEYEKTMPGITRRSQLHGSHPSNVQPFLEVPRNASQSVNKTCSTNTMKLCIVCSIEMLWYSWSMVGYSWIFYISIWYQWNFIHLHIIGSKTFTFCAIKCSPDLNRNSYNHTIPYIYVRDIMASRGFHLKCSEILNPC